MPEEKHPLKVFLCHASADKPSVRELYRYLKRRGIQPWLDAENLIPGQAWQVEIPKAINTSDAIIICLTKNSIDKEGYVQKEIRFALDKALEMPEGRIFLIPARLEECDLPYSLKNFHWVDLFEEAGYSKLMRALKLRASQLHRTDLAVSSQPAPAHAEPEDVVPSLIPAKPLGKGIAGGESVADAKPATIAKHEQARPHRNWNTRIVVALIGLVGTIFVAMLSSQFIENLFSLGPGPSATETSPAPTFTPALLTESTTLVSSPAAGTHSPSQDSSDYTDPRDISMRLVSEGQFTMGVAAVDALATCLIYRDDCQLIWFTDEEPVHPVYLEAFYIDTYEVTNAAYQACVDEGVCDPPKRINSSTRPEYYGKPEFNNYPVIHVDWEMAKTYCENWRDGALPTEAQWEIAARATDDRIYPWGDDIEETFANYNYILGDTTEVGSYPDGKSPYGLHDMAGNVWEWGADWYGSSYYEDALMTNPTGPDSGQYRILRGGSWSDDGAFLRVSMRGRNEPGVIVDNGFGFRCARPAP